MTKPILVAARPSAFIGPRVPIAGRRWRLVPQQDLLGEVVIHVEGPAGAVSIPIFQDEVNLLGDVVWAEVKEGAMFESLTLVLTC